MLQVDDNKYIETPAAMLKYLCRTTDNQKLFNEDDFSCNAVDTLISYMFKNICLPL